VIRAYQEQFGAIIVLSRGTMKSVTRIGELSAIFQGGESKLLNGIARLSIFYEDLQLEMSEFRELHRRRMEDHEDGLDYRLLYFLRRALATLVEFRGALTRVKQTDEFKKADLTDIDARFIADADRFLQQNWATIKELRNEFAGHIQGPAVEFATKNLTDQVGGVTWRPDHTGWRTGIECEFAGVILAGVISSKLQAGGDVEAEFSKAFAVISEGFNLARFAMVALVHAFLWDRFGR
jgi:hypothetical protein